MPKPKTPVFRKLKPAPPAMRALIKKQNQQRVRQLVKTARLNRRMAKHFASLIDLTPKNIPASVLRQIQTETRRAIRVMSGKPARAPRR